MMDVKPVVGIVHKKGEVKEEDFEKMVNVEVKDIPLKSEEMLVIHRDGKPVVILYWDGGIKFVDQSYRPVIAAKAFWEAVNSLRPDWARRKEDG